MISFILLNVIYMYMYMNISPTMYAHSVFFVIFFDELATRPFEVFNNHLCFLVYSSILILHTVWRATHWNMPYENKYDDYLPLLFIYPFHILSPVYICDSSRLSLYLPAIVDIVDGIQMTENQLDPINPVWVQTLICLAVFMCYIPSLYEIHHLRFPEPTTGSIKLSKRTVNRIQLVSSVVFLVLRLVLLLACGESDLFDVFKSIIRFYVHYKMWLKLRCRRKIVSVEAREISADKALYFDEEKKAFLALRDAIILLMQTFRRNETEMRISV